MLDQTHSGDEIIVVADTDEQRFDPADDIGLRVLQQPEFAAAPPGAGNSASTPRAGRCIALLDDDDDWSPTKLARQLEVAEAMSGADHWIVSSRMAVLGPGMRQTDLAATAHQAGAVGGRISVSFQRTLSFGGTALQTSTLCFPTDLARTFGGTLTPARLTMSRAG